MDIFNALRSPPDRALEVISGGRQKGYTSIEPMWRLEALTQCFGPCGTGWKYEIVRQWLDPGADGEVMAFCNINLYYKQDGEWSGPIPGTGGSSFVAMEKNGLYTNKECYKMALTDAISVACKALGMAADVYWGNEKKDPSRSRQQGSSRAPVCQACGKEIVRVRGETDGRVRTPNQIVDFSLQHYGKILCFQCQKKEDAEIEARKGGRQSA